MSMKQSITPEQWESIGKGHQDTFTKAIYPSAVVEMFGVRIDEEYPSIGQMIQFLGEDLHSLMFMSPVWTIGGKFGAKQGKELINILWSACKFKLTTKSKSDEEGYSGKMIIESPNERIATGGGGAGSHG